MQKVIIIGLDGGTLELMDPWMDKGHLPNFDKIRKQGVYGKLRSTMPYYSAPAWVSIVTGCGPGKHGIYDFFRTDSFSKKLVSSKYRKVPAIWNLLTNYQKKSIIVNFPVAYPPETINGIMISGLLTPSQKSDFTYPKELKKELNKDELGEYELEQVAIDDIPKYLYAKYAPEKLVEQINQMTTSHAMVTINLMKKNAWDFSMVVFRGTDDAQHLLWDKKDLILSCYKKVDYYLGEMMKLFPNALFIIVSDHGFDQAKKYLYVNNVLYNSGFLKTFSPPNKSIDNITMWAFNKISSLIFHLLPIRKITGSSVARKLIMSGGGRKNINLFKTTAVYHSICSRGIRINLKDKYPQGIIERKDYEKIMESLMELFNDLKDPKTGERVVNHVYRWEEIYGKDAVNDPLDLILDLERGYGTQEILGTPEGIQYIFRSKNEPLPILATPSLYDWIGDHSPNGIIYMYGENICSSQRIDAFVTDIVPTMLAAMGLPVPNHIDGKVIENAFIKKPSIKKADLDNERHLT